MKMDKISEQLGTQTGKFPVVEDSELKNQLAEVKSKEIDTTSDDLKKKMIENKTKDYEDARKNIKHMIDQGMSAIPEMFGLVRESENPRMYDAASGFLKTLMDMNKGLISISDDYEKRSAKENKSLNDNKAPVEPQIQQTNVYVGTTEELLNSVKNKKTSKNKNDNVIDVDFDDIEKED